VDVVRLSPDGRELPGLLAATGLASTSGRRRLLGIAGAPGAGKSTMAVAVAGAVPGSVVVPMDGFHLADAELRRRGILDRKGAPETFDGWGYAALLGRLRTHPDHVVMAPAFERELEQPLAGAVPVPPAAPLVITEGNYLLLDESPWREVRAQLDVVWLVRTEDPLRKRRLAARHVEFGKSEEGARAWVERVDEPNTRLVSADSAGAADLVLDLTAWAG
jgi:pantothenate kinase